MNQISPDKQVPKTHQHIRNKALLLFLSGNSHNALLPSAMDRNGMQWLILFIIHPLSIAHSCTCSADQHPLSRVGRPIRSTLHYKKLCAAEYGNTPWVVTCLPQRSLRWLANVSSEQSHFEMRNLNAARMA